MSISPDQGATILADFRKELDAIQRENSYGLQGLADGFGHNNPNLSETGTMVLPFTLSNANSYVPITLNRILLSYSYMTQGLLRTVVDQPIEDAFRGGIQIKSGELDDEELKQLNKQFRSKRHFCKKSTKDPMSKANARVGYNVDNSDLEAVKMAAKWSRLYGGAGIIINTDQDFRKELDIEKIKQDSPLAFIAADRWELLLSQLNVYSEANPTPYNYYGLPLHRSRVVRMLGSEAPSYIRLQLQGWGMSVLEESIRAVSAYLKFENLLFELLDEAKIDVYKIKGLNTALMTDSGTSRIQRRVALSNQLKSYSNALSMDSEDDYHQKQLTFSGLAEIKEGLRTDLCAYLKFPKNKLFGESAGGFSSGKDSMDNYNSLVEIIREGCEPLLMQASSLRCQQMFGHVPEDLEIVWAPLDILDGVEQESVKTSKQNRILGKFSVGLTNAQEASQELRREGLQDMAPTEVEQGLRDVDPLAVAGGGGEGDSELTPKKRTLTQKHIPRQGQTAKD